MRKLYPVLAREHILVLFSFDLLKEPSNFHELLARDNTFEFLKTDNYREQSDRIRYTTVLKAKGLERDVVVLVCSSAKERINIYQLFVGSSRTKVKLYLFLLKPDP